MTKSQLTATAISSEEFGGCNDLDRHDNQKWFDLGGVDIVAWGSEITIYADQQAAIDYIVECYDLSSVEIR